VAESQEKNIEFSGLLSAAFKGAVGEETIPGSILDYIEGADLTEADSTYLTDMAGHVGSDLGTARGGSPLNFTTLMKILYGEATGSRPEGPYHGQSIETFSNPEDAEESEWYKMHGYKDRNDFHGVADAPHLLNIFLGKETPEDQGLEESPYEPTGGYPFKDGPVYNAEPFFNIMGLDSSDPKDIVALEDKVHKMNPGDVISLKDTGVNPIHHKSVDLGKMNWSIGKNEKGEPYLAMADIWDFSGSTGEWGEIMDKIGKTPINFYGRFPLTYEQFGGY
tara:strand:- start:144 stop:977 length:834 start_codon:yes stop_codon:yes gene_type:complete